MFKVFEIMNMDMYRVNRNHPARFSTHSDLGPGRENALSLGIVFAAEVGDEIFAAESDCRNTVRAGVADLLDVHDCARCFDQWNDLEGPDWETLFILDRFEQLAEEINVFSFLAFGVHKSGDPLDGQLVYVAQQLAAFSVVDAGIEYAPAERAVGNVSQNVVAGYLFV